VGSSPQKPTDKLFALPPRLLTIGLISDTHGLLRPQALDALRGVDFIVHAGDIGAAVILEGLGELAPVTTVGGNNDLGGWADALPLLSFLWLGASQVQVVHELPHLAGQPLPDGTRAVVYGHSHRPAIDQRDGVLYINPGSAGLRRFKLPVTLAMLRLDGASLHGDIVPLL
jgi:putative phosphoesterase